jgi:NADH:ubiquinone oxidoreductase subunit 2 (subunit N)
VLFRAVLNANFIILAVLGILTVIVSIYYYINFLIHLYMHERCDPSAPACLLVPPADLAIGLACAVILVGILWLGVIPDSLLQVISSIVATLPNPL